MIGDKDIECIVLVSGGTRGNSTIRNGVIKIKI